MVWTGHVPPSGMQTYKTAGGRQLQFSTSANPKTPPEEFRTAGGGRGETVQRQTLTAVGVEEKQEKNKLAARHWDEKRKQHGSRRSVYAAEGKDTKRRAGRPRPVVPRDRDRSWETG